MPRARSRRSCRASAGSACAARRPPPSRDPAPPSSAPTWLHRQATSCCCAPSWMLRSILRRSSSWARTNRRREARDPRSPHVESTKPAWEASPRSGGPPRPQRIVRRVCYGDAPPAAPPDAGPRPPSTRRGTGEAPVDERERDPRRRPSGARRLPVGVRFRRDARFSSLLPSRPRGPCHPRQDFVESESPIRSENCDSTSYGEARLP